MPNSSSDRVVVKLLRHQAALAAFGSFAFLEPDLVTVLTEAARICAAALEVPFCSICRYRVAENDFLIEAGWGWHPDVVGQVMSQADENSPQTQAYVTEKPVSIRDVQVVNNLALPGFYKQHSVVSTVDVVIPAIDGAPYGMLEIDSTSQHQHDVHDANFLTSFANMLAEAVATAIRVKALQDELNANSANVLAEAVVTAIRFKALRDALDANMLAEAAISTSRVKVLRDALDAKNLLTNELHHRVRHNPLMILGVLENYARGMTSDTVQGTIDMMVRRMTTLAQVYDSLLSVGLSGRVNLADYLEALCVSLPAVQTKRSYPVNILFNMKPVMLGVEETSTLGMVVAELMTNSCDHAFPDREGKITVSLACTNSYDATLTVEDNGVGFPDIASSSAPRNGLSLVTRLMDRIGGTSNSHFNAGTVWRLRFPVPALSDETRATA